MRTLKILFLTLFLTVLASARSVVGGDCSQGGQRVTTQGVQSSTYVQRNYPSCNVVVYLAGTTTPATVFSTFGGASLANPFVAGSTGYWFFWADEGQYDIVLSGAAIGTPITRYAAVGSVASGGLLAANNLSDLNSIPTARTNLGLGGAALLSVGTSAGSVAAGDDGRFPLAGQKSALAGSSGTPGTGNKYITQDDVSATSAASKIPRLGAGGLLAAGMLDYTGQYATTSQPGFLSAADWNTFNAKSPTGGITSLTGDGTASGPGAAAFTIAANAVTLAKFQQISTGTILGRNTSGAGNVEDLSTIPSGVQDLITRVGTLVSGSIPYSLLTGAPATQNAASDGVTKGVVTFQSSDMTCTLGVCLINYGAGQTATSGRNGFLSAVDWITFNGKQDSGNFVSSLTGDATASGPGAAVVTVVNLPTGVTQSGYLRLTAMTAPGTPAAGFGRFYLDSTAKNFAIKDDAGIIKHGVQTQAIVARQVIQSITDTGAETLMTVSDPQNATCTGTASASATLFVIQTTGAACNNTAETIAAGAFILAQHAGNLANLRVLATAGVASGSGVITLRIGAVDTIVTCTVGVGTTCSDVTHTATVAAGDRISIKMVTVGAETLANVLIAFEY